MRKQFALLFLILILLFHPLYSWAWSDKKTHQDLSIKAVEYSILSPTKGDYLKMLGFDKNLEEKFPLNGEYRNVRDWIRLGSKEEDAGNVFTAYYYHHFHNPLRVWAEAGLTTPYPFINGESSLIWAQDDKEDTTPANPWRWQKMREYFYIALTGKDYNGNLVAGGKIQRDAFFANTLKGLGHLIHLIQDSAQPAHVRDDPHPLDDKGIVPQFENWAKYNAERLGLYNLPPIFPDVPLNISINGYTPITQFWDINQYNGTNPDTAIGSTIGIAEYTNANFFSEDTILTNFTYPAWSTVVEYEEEIDASTGEVRSYLKKIGAGENIQHLAAGVWFYKYLPTEYKRFGLRLDENVYKDYAHLLLPRAVGYSASLIDYFFRGKIDFAVDDGDRVDGVKGIRVSNLSNEDMDGTFSLYYDAVDGSRYLLGSWTLLLSAQGTSPVLSFSFPENNIELHRYILVFRGRMGMEADAVAGYIHGVGWKEDWDAGLYDNHNWVYSETDLAGQNPNNGMSINNMSSGKLVKENVRYAGSDMARVNETYIGVADEVINGNYYLGGYAIHYDFTDRFPMQVNSTTWLSLKIDAMSINEPVPAQSCGVTEWPTGDYQGLSFEFRLGDGSTRKLVFTASGHESYMWPTILVPLSQDYSVNVYDLLVAWGGITEPVYLDSINIIQQMLNLCAPSSIEHRQHMEVDYIRMEKR